MRSKALSIQATLNRTLNRQINLEDVAFLTSLHQFDVAAIKKDLHRIFDEDGRQLRERLAPLGLGTQYKRILSDHEYRTGQALLGASETRRTRKQKILHVVARIQIYRLVVVSLLHRLADQVEQLNSLAANLLRQSALTTSDASTIMRAGRKIDDAKGLSRETSSTLDDYSHYLDLAHHLCGDRADLYGSRYRADVYTFQLDCAIRELFASRTESCDAAPFLIRSRLEVSIARVIFGQSLPAGPRYAPTREPRFPQLVKSCKKAGLTFTSSHESLQLVWETLNLVVHLGLRLNTGITWHMFELVRSLRPIAKDKQDLALRVQTVLEALESNSLVRRLPVGETTEGLTILWRY